MIPETDPRVQDTFRLRDAHWRAIGPTDPDLITYLINPQFSGAPAWPGTRQAYRVARPEGGLIIASDGLSDPFGADDPRQGFGCEVYLETPDLVGGDFSAIRASWAFAAVEQFAMNVAGWGGISEALAHHGVLSLELHLDPLTPKGFANAAGRCGFLVGLKTPYPAKLSLPLGEIDLIALTLLTPAELDEIVEGGDAARNAIAAKRAQSGRWRSSVKSH